MNESTPSDQSGPDVDAIVRQPLEALKRLGVQRPSGMTLEQFLGHFVQHQLLSGATVAAWLALYEETRYGGRLPDAGVAREISRRLTDEMTRIGVLDEAVKRPLLEHLAKLPPPDEQTILPHLGNAEAMAPGATGGDLLPRQQMPLSPIGQISLDNRIRLIGLVAVVWSLLMVALGYGQAERLANWLDDARTAVFGHRPYTGERHLAHVRDYALANPYDGDGWRQYADTSYHLKQYAEATIAWRYLLAQSPDDYDLLNSLAWLLATAEDPLYRRPREALQLAEKAFNLNKSDHITDTLAEANWLNGNRDQAIELERRAIRITRDPELRAFYEQQLHRFMTVTPPPLPPEPPLGQFSRSMP